MRVPVALQRNHACRFAGWPSYVLCLMISLFRREEIRLPAKEMIMHSNRGRLRDLFEEVGTIGELKPDERVKVKSLLESLLREAAADIARKSQRTNVVAEEIFDDEDRR